jgi:multidrug resistance efflux pump
MIIKKLSLRFSILVMCTLFVGGCDIMLENGTSAKGLQASGVVETVEIIIASETAGRVEKVWVSEGDSVSGGDKLFQIENKLLVSQMHQAESALNVTEANYDLIAAGLTDEQKKAAIASAELALASSEYDLERIYKNTNLQAAEALESAENLEKQLEDLKNPVLQKALAIKAIADAEKGIEDAERYLNTVRSSADQAAIDAAEAQVVLAKDALDEAKEDFEPYENKPETNLQRANFQAKLAAAQQSYDAAVRRLNALESRGTENDIAVAEADLSVAEALLAESEKQWERIKNGPEKSDIALLEAQIEKAYQDYDTYKNGPDPDDIVLAEKQVENAKAQLALAKADMPTQEQLVVAAAEVDLARSNLENLQVQLDMLVVRSPIDGVIMTRSIHPGEVIQPGLAALTLGQLEKLTITVYIPEDQYGIIALGDAASLKTDSFPNDIFEAVVTRIADRAEYTPRNVQTKEERQTTVYGVELSVSDPEGKLKPGMPCDVTFD